jgi:hypothetical protein
MQNILNKKTPVSGGHQTKQETGLDMRDMNFGTKI